MTDDDDRWLVIDGRRWRRTDPSLPEGVVQELKSHLGRSRSAVTKAKASQDEVALRAARDRVQLAKTGLGERGPYWWQADEADRLAQAHDALRQLDD